MDQAKVISLLQQALAELQAPGGLTVTTVTTPTVPPVTVTQTPPSAFNPLYTFDALKNAAPEFVAWRWLMQAGNVAQAAMIARIGQTEYNQNVNRTSYESPQVIFAQGRAYYVDPKYTGPYPASITSPGYISVAIPT